MHRALIALLAMACGPVERPPVTTVATAPSAANSPAPSASVSSPPPALFATITTPSSVACAIETKDVKTPIPIFTRADASPFAEVVSGPLRLVIPQVGEAIAEVARSGIELRAVARPPLHAVAPMMLWGVFSVAATADLGFNGGKAGMLVPVLLRRQIFDPEPPLEAHPCNDFAIDIAKYDPRELVPKGSAKFKPRIRRLTGDRPIKLSATATDPPIGALSSGFGNSKVTELAQASGRSLISMPLDDGILVGWVTSADVEAEEKLFGLIGTGGPTVPKSAKGETSTPTIYDVVCGHDLRVIADLSGHNPKIHAGAPLTVIGTIRAGSKFTYRSRESALMPILGIAGVSPQLGVIAVELAAMVDCKRTAQ